MCARISAGRFDCSITLAMVKVLPEPVTPSSTWCFSPAAKPLHQLVDGPRLIAPRLVGGHQLKVHEGIIPSRAKNRRIMPRVSAPRSSSSCHPERSEGSAVALQFCNKWLVAPIPVPFPFTNPAEGAPGPSQLGTGEPQLPDIEIISRPTHALLASVRITNCGSTAMRVRSARAAASGWRRPDSQCRTASTDNPKRAAKRAGLGRWAEAQTPPPQIFSPVFADNFAALLHNSPIEELWLPVSHAPAGRK